MNPHVVDEQIHPVWIIGESLLLTAVGNSLRRDARLSVNFLSLKGDGGNASLQRGIALYDSHASSMADIRAQVTLAPDLPLIGLNSGQHNDLQLGEQVYSQQATAGLGVVLHLLSSR